MVSKVRYSQHQIGECERCGVELTATESGVCSACAAIPRTPPRKCEHSAIGTCLVPHKEHCPFVCAYDIKAG